jgi:hypothetical protein
VRQDVVGGKRSADHRNGPDPRKGTGRRQYCCSAEAVANQQLRCHPPIRHGSGGADDILHVVRKALAELALALAQAGEVKAQDANASISETPAEASGRQRVFVAGEAVGEDCVGSWLNGASIKCPGELPTGVVRKVEVVRRHALAVFGIGMVETIARIPRGSLVSVSRHAACILEHPREMHQVPRHEGGVSLREIIIQTYSVIAI